MRRRLRRAEAAAYGTSGGRCVSGEKQRSTSNVPTFNVQRTSERTALSLNVGCWTLDVGYRRAKLVIDMSTRTPRIIYRRNLAPLGWALGNEIRDALAARKELR